jgi:integrase
LFVHLKGNGERRKMGLGSASTYTLADARELAVKYRKIIDRGEDPIEVRKAELQAKATERDSRKTFRECAVEYIRLHESSWRNQKHRKDWPSSLASYVYPLMGDQDIATVGKADVLRVLEQPVENAGSFWLAKTETAERVKSRIRFVMDWAVSRDYCKSSPGLWDEVTTALPPASKIKKTGHFAAAPYAAVPGMIEQVRASTAGADVKAAFEYCILTAARSGDVRGAMWSEIDLNGKTWTIPAERMKAGREHRVPLSDRAVAILRTLERHANGGLVFRTGKGTAYSDAVFTALLARLKIDVTMHGFRSSFKDWARETTNFPEIVSEMALAHLVGDATVQAYGRSDLFNRRRDLMDAWSAYCTVGDQISSTSGAN